MGGTGCTGWDGCWGDWWDWVPQGPVWVPWGVRLGAMGDWSRLHGGWTGYHGGVAIGAGEIGLGAPGVRLGVMRDWSRSYWGVGLGAMGQGVGLVLGGWDWVAQGLDWMLRWGGTGYCGRGETSCFRGSAWGVDWVLWGRGRMGARTGTGYLGPGWCSGGWQHPDPHCSHIVPSNITLLSPQSPALTLQRQVPPASSWPPRASHLTSSWPAGSEGEGGGHPRMCGSPSQHPPLTNRGALATWLDGVSLVAWSTPIDGWGTGR